MMASFLQTSFLAGLAALAVPILIHLFFRLKTKRVELGTIRFLRVVLEENARRRKIMQWLLLALRMGFVALLAVLFARPFLTATASSGEKELIVILIDQSATMQLRGDHGRLIEQAVSEAKELIVSAGLNSRFEVAFFDHAVHPIAESKSNEGSLGPTIVGQLQAPSTAFGATNFGAAFAWARDICVKAPAGPKQLHLFTDLQQSGLDWTEVEPLPAEVRTHLHDLGSPVVNNVAINEVRAARTWIHPGDSPTVRASVVHGGAFALDELSVVMEIGRVPDTTNRTQKSSRDETPPSTTTDFATLQERISKRERIKLESGATVTLDFELPPLSAGLWQGRVRVEYDDDLSFDNQRYFAISATPAYRVLVVNTSDNISPLLSETYFLEAALRLSEDDSTFSESPFEPSVVSYDPKQGLPTLTSFDAIVLANVANISKTDAAQLAAFTRSGGGLLIFTGDSTSLSACSSLHQEALSPGEIGEIKIATDLPWRLTKWDETHPIFQPLSDPQHGDLRRLMFAAYTKVTPAADCSVIAQFHTGDPAVVERQVGNGSVLWMTTSCGRDWSDWCRSRLYLPTVHQLLGYQVGLTAGGRIRNQLVDSPMKNQEESREPLAPSASNVNDARKTPPRTSIPGITQFERYTEVTNTSPRESETDRCTKQEFEDRFAVKFVDTDVPTVAAAAQDNIEFRKDEIWHWVACALLAVLLLEGFVGNRTTA